MSLKRFTRPLLAGGVILAVGLIATESAAAPGAGSPDGSGKVAARFTECMRSNGIPEFPGVTVTDDGRVLLNLDDGTVDPLSKEYRSAAEACASHLPKGSGLPSAPKPPKPSKPSPPGSPAASGPAGPPAPRVP